MRALLFVTSAFACFLGITRTERGTWVDGLLAASTLALAIGLAQQARAIRAALRCGDGIDTAVRRGWQIAVEWRRAVCVIVVAYWSVEIALDVAAVSQEPNPFLLRDDAGSFGILLLCVVVALGSTPCCVPRPRSRFLSRVEACLGWPAAVLAFLATLFGAAVLLPLVHIAIQGVIAAEPYRIAGHVIQSYDPVAIHEQERHFALVTVPFLITAVAANVCFIQAVRARAGSFMRLVYRVGLAVCLVSATGFSTWIRVAGLAAINPLMAQTQAAYPWHHWLAAGWLLGLASAVATGRLLLLRGVPGENDRPLAWRNRRDRYWNENRLVLLLLSVANVAAFAYSWADPPWMIWSLDPVTVGRLAVLWLCVRGLTCGRDEVGERVLQSSVRVRPAALFATWSVILLLIATSVEAIIWSTMAFGLCLG